MKIIVSVCLYYIQSSRESSFMIGGRHWKTPPHRFMRIYPKFSNNHYENNNEPLKIVTTTLHDIHDFTMFLF